MSYTALYRKFRPKDFSEVKGQDHIVKTLKNQIEADRKGHAYLFCGTRGTGKTSMAKIFAKAVNCENPVNGSPCGCCDSCKAIAEGTSMNVIEIDAASNNGVDNIREIREEVAYRPTEGRYKVYIIDEVHMLSSGAFNALLKTLEEPPEYVIFILATTEVHKIPVTILSRCQRYDFKRITVDTISDRLNELLAQEGIEAEEKAVRYIARQADGAMRDALSLLDQCIAFYLGQKLTYENVLSVLGAVDTEVFRQLFVCVLNSDVKGCMDIISGMVTEGRDLGQFILDFGWYLRNLMLVKTDCGASDALDMSEENLKLLMEAAEECSIETIMRFIHIISELSNQIKYASQKRVLIETTLIRLCMPQMDNNELSLNQRIENLERKLENGMVVTSQSPVTSVKAETPSENKVLERALTEDLQAIANQWDNMVKTEFSLMDKRLLLTAIPTVGSDGELLLVFPAGDSISETMYLDEEKKLQIEQKLAEKTGKKINLRVKIHEGSGNPKDIYFDIRSNIKTDIVIDDEEEDF